MTEVNQAIQLPIHETFQSTVQGEGFWTGTLVDFIRLAGCPVGCSWCDTGYSDGGKHTPRELRSLHTVVQELQSPRVVISGGEPLIHQSVPILVKAIFDTGRTVNIETSGAFWQDLPLATWITLSPKQHISPKFPVQTEVWQRADEIKLIISTGDEVEFYQPYLKELSHRPVFLQPEWSVRDRAMPIILKLLRQYPNFRLSLQTHKYIGVA